MQPMMIGFNKIFTKFNTIIAQLVENCNSCVCVYTTKYIGSLSGLDQMRLYAKVLY